MEELRRWCYSGGCAYVAGGFVLGAGEGGSTRACGETTNMSGRRNIEKRIRERGKCPLIIFVALMKICDRMVTKMHNLFFFVCVCVLCKKFPTLYTIEYLFAQLYKITCLKLTPRVRQTN